MVEGVVLIDAERRVRRGLGIGVGVVSMPTVDPPRLAVDILPRMNKGVS